MQFADRFELGEKLGEGSMGIVYRARHLQLDLEFAIKVLHPQFASDPTFRARFLREARVVHSFIHKRSVTLREFGITDDGTPYLAMDLARGVKLSSILRSEGSLPPKRAITIAMQVAEVLEEAHAHGIFHRDIKPDNIMLDPSSGEDQIKVMDFGIAKLASAESTEASLTRGNAIGTPLYMSPEQAAGEALDGRSDLYSLGVVLWECLTGGPPFHGSSVQAILMKHLTQEPPPPPQGSMDSRLEALLRKALAKLPDNRFPTAAAFRTAFLTWLEAPPEAPAQAPALAPARAPAQVPAQALGEVPLEALRAPGPLPAALGQEIVTPQPGASLSLRRERPDAEISGEMPSPLRQAFPHALEGAESSGATPALSVSPAREAEEDTRNTVIALPSPTPIASREPRPSGPPPTLPPGARDKSLPGDADLKPSHSSPERPVFPLRPSSASDVTLPSTPTPMPNKASVKPSSPPPRNRRPSPEELEAAATEPAIELVRRAAQIRAEVDGTSVKLDKLLAPSPAAPTRPAPAPPPARAASNSDPRFSLRQERLEGGEPEEPPFTVKRRTRSWILLPLLFLLLLLVTAVVLARGGWLPEPLVRALLPDIPSLERVFALSSTPPPSATPGVAEVTEHLEALGTSGQQDGNSGPSTSKPSGKAASASKAAQSSSSPPCPVLELDRTSRTYYVRCLEVTLQGEAPSGATQLFMAGKPVSVRQGRYSIPLHLVDGVNRISLSGLSASGPQSLTLIVDRQPPVLTLRSPRDGETFLRRRVVLEGEVEEANLAAVKVGGGTVAVNRGLFRKEIMLVPGPNRIRIQAVDLAGNQETLEATLNGPGPR